MVHCVNKFQPPGSCSGYPFKNADEHTAETFASLLGKYALDAHRFNTFAVPKLRRYIAKYRMVKVMANVGVGAAPSPVVLSSQA